MKVQKSVAVTMFEELGSKAASTWNKTKLLAKLQGLPALINDETDAPEDKEAKKLFEAIRKDAKVVESIVIQDDEEEEEEEADTEEKSEKKAKGKKAAKEDDSDEEESEDDEESDDADEEEEDSDEDEADDEDEEPKAKKGKKGKKGKSQKTSTPGGKGKVVKKADKKAKKEKGKKKPAKESAEKDAFGSRIGCQSAAINAVMKAKPQTVAEIAEAAELPEYRIRGHLQWMMTEGFVTKSDKGYGLKKKVEK